jgi:mono/diheme cytochrome c family protein
VLSLGIALPLGFALACSSGGSGDGATPDAADSDASPAAPDPCLAVRGPPPDDAAAQAGFDLVSQNHCQQCHRGDLGGDVDGLRQPNGGNAYPANLTPESTTGLGCWTSDEIVRAILDGTDKDGRTLCAPMPRFADAGLDQAGATTIVAYLRSLRPVVRSIPETGACTSPPSDAGGDARVDGGDGGP